MSKCYYVDRELIIIKFKRIFNLCFEKKKQKIGTLSKRLNVNIGVNI